MSKPMNELWNEVEPETDLFKVAMQVIKLSEREKSVLEFFLQASNAGAGSHSDLQERVWLVQMLSTKLAEHDAEYMKRVAVFKPTPFPCQEPQGFWLSHADENDPFRRLQEFWCDGSISDAGLKGVWDFIKNDHADAVLAMASLSNGCLRILFNSHHGNFGTVEVVVQSSGAIIACIIPNVVQGRARERPIDEATWAKVHLALIGDLPDDED